MPTKDVAAVFADSVGHTIAPAEADRFLAHYFAPGELAGRAALDAGCRVGDYTLALARAGAAPACGVDLAAACIAAARRRAPAGVDFRVGDVLDLPFPDDRFDLALATTTLSYLPPERVPRALAELARVVRPGGTLLVLFLRPRGPAVRLAVAAAHRLPAPVWRRFVTALSRLPPALAAALLGRPVAPPVLSYLLWGLQGAHLGVPLAIPAEHEVETARCEDCSPRTCASYRLTVPEGPPERAWGWLGAVAP